MGTVEIEMVMSDRINSQCQLVAAANSELSRGARSVVVNCATDVLNGR